MVPHRLILQKKLQLLQSVQQHPLLNLWILWIHFLHDHCEKGNLGLQHVDPHNQLTDILTKPLDQAAFARL